MTREEAERIAAPMMLQYRQQYERGDPLGLIQAMRHAIMWSLPVPDWASEHALKAIEFYYTENGGAPGRGKTGSLRAKAKRDRIDRWRHRAADRELAMRQYGIIGGSKEAAFQRASDSLKHTPAQGEPRQIKRSYAKVEKSFKQNSDQ